MPKRLTYDEVKRFIETESECKLISKEYIKNSSKLKLRCKCGNIFEASFMKFKQCNKRQCNSCSNQEFWTLERVEATLNQFDHELIGEYSNINANTKIIVKCPVNHEFETDIHHFNSHKTRCPKCNGGKIKTNEEFLMQLHKEVGNEYIALDKYKNAYTKIKLFHVNCKSEFYTSPSCFLNQGTRCMRCGSPRNSKGHSIITKYLFEHKIEYQEEKSFPGCKNKLPLHFDIFIRNSILIEYDGQQHFSPIKTFGGNDSFKKCLINDQIKNQYCIDNNIPLIRIPYWEFNNIEYVLDNVLQHFNIINKKDTYKRNIVLTYLVNENWNHNKYINMENKIII